MIVTQDSIVTVEQVLPTQQLRLAHSITTVHQEPPNQQNVIQVRLLLQLVKDPPQIVLTVQPEVTVMMDKHRRLVP